jgi:hypothetical protein
MIKKSVHLVGLAHVCVLVCECSCENVNVLAPLTYLVRNESLHNSRQEELCTITKICVVLLGQIQIQITTSFCQTERTFDIEPTKRYIFHCFS